ncbi:MAG: glycosyltransferase [Planktomarina sp.]
MKLLFVHQNMPGQYRELVEWIVAQGNHEVAFLTQKKKLELPGVRKILYEVRNTPKKDAFTLSKEWERTAGVGLAAARALEKHVKTENWVPDIMIGHVGWGEMTFLKEILPNTPMIGFFEYFYILKGGIKGFDPNDQPTEWSPYILKGRNVVNYVNIESVDLGHTPMKWQRDTFPKSFHHKMYVCHDGIRTDKLRPNPNVQFKLGRMDKAITRNDEIITYMTRSLEPTRGFHMMMRAIPKIQRKRPNVRIIIIGENSNSYGSKSNHEGGYKGEMLDELRGQLDMSRIHFMGRVPYQTFQQIVQISRCHVYLTMPFVLSWSFLESMSMEATVVAADVGPVREVVDHGRNGFLVDFFDPEALANQVVDVLAHQKSVQGIGAAARKTVECRYDFNKVCLPRHAQEINNLAQVPRAQSLIV